MYCPKCPETALFRKKTTDHNFEIDICPRCRGIWFDDTELGKVLGNRAQRLDRVPVGSILQEMCRCPKCKDGLYTFCYPETLTMVEMCKTCLGMFLDNKEWKKIHDSRENVVLNCCCPKCQHMQVRAEACFACGYIFPTKPKFSEMDDRNAPSGKRHLSFQDHFFGFVDKSMGMLKSSD